MKLVTKIFTPLIAFGLSTSLFGSTLPSSKKLSIASIKDKKISLSSPLKYNYMSGVVIHKYSKSLSSVVGYIVQEPQGVRMLELDAFNQDAIPTATKLIAKGDRVIAGYLYNNMLIIAPNEKSYESIHSRFRKNWIHPDLLALFLNQEGESYPTPKLLQKFSLAYQVGLICIVKQDKTLIYDPISMHSLYSIKTNTNTQKRLTPFFTRVEHINRGWLGSKDTTPYEEIYKAFK